MARWFAGGLRRRESLGPSEPPFLIEHDATAAEWTLADRSARAAEAERLGGPVVLEALELAVDDPNPASLRLVRTVGLRFRPSLSGGGSRDASLGTQLVRLRPRRGGSATPTIRLQAGVAAERAIELFGCRWVVVPRR